MTTDDDTDHLRALLADEHARAEKAEAERDLLFDALNLHMRKTGITNEAMERVEAFRAVVDANDPLVRGECTRLAKGWNDAADARKAAEAERDAALAACAEMRAALLIAHGQPHPEDNSWHCPTCALLSRPDLGAGMVVVPREVVERVTEVVGWYADNGRGTAHGIRKAAALLVDLDALLKKGGG